MERNLSSRQHCRPVAELRRRRFTIGFLKKRVWALLVVPLSLISLMAPQVSRAQTMGAATLQGTVTDVSGAVVPAASVAITSQLTGVSRKLTSNSAGFFSSTDMQPGTYKIVVTKAGFSPHETDDILLRVGEIRQVDVELQVTASSKVVVVSSVTNSLDTTSSSVQGVVTGATTRELPLNGRDFTELAALEPGVSQVLTQYGVAATSTTRLSRGFGSQLSIGGNRPQEISYLLDGINTNDYANGSPGSVSGAILGVDAVQEFSVISSNAPAEYGRTAGGVVNSIIRSGTNAFHGSVYDYLRNSVFDARNYFDPSTIPSFRRNQFGASASGPILRNKTFFFANYEGFRQSLGAAMQDIVPSPNARAGVLSSGTVAVDPKVAPYLALYPIPPASTVKGDTGVYSFVTQQPTNEDFSLVHLDHNISENDMLHGSFLYDRSSLSSADPSDAVIDEAISRRATAAVQYVHVFSTELTNALRVGYNRSVASGPQQKAVINPAANDSSLGYFPGANVGALRVSGLTNFNGGVGAVGSYTYHSNSYQFYDDVALVRGNHSLAFGASVERLQDNELAGLLPFGEWSFGSIKNFLTNVPQFFTSGLPTLPVRPTDLRTTVAGAYIQDNWRFRRNLTLNLGLRYEMNTDITETANNLGELITPTDPSVTHVSTYFSNNPTSKNFEPRVGFAWAPFGRERTVLRAGFGFYDVLPLPYMFGLQAVSSYPIYDESENTSVAKGSFPTNGFPPGFVPPVRAMYVSRSPGRDYVMQYTMNVQQKLTRNMNLSVDYIGWHGVHQLFTANDMNFVLPVTLSPMGYVWPAKGTEPTLNPAIGIMSHQVFEGSSIYHSLQTSLRYTGGRVQAMLSYTWSRSIDDSSSNLSGASFDNSVSNAPYFDLRLNRGPSDLNVSNMISAYSVTALPDPPERWGPLAAPFRGWSLQNILSIRSGLPFTVTVGGDPLGSLTSTTFDRPDQVSKTGCTRPQNIFYLNTSCFAFPGTYQYAPGLFGPILGDAGRNGILGPGSFVWTVGVTKTVAIRERLHMEFDAEAFNVTNRPNFSNPISSDTQIFNASGKLLSSAGEITSTSSTSRQLQFAIKFLF
jgi:outer membrane receptor protein involved in Fe transport